MLLPLPLRAPRCASCFSASPRTRWRRKPDLRSGSPYGVVDTEATVEIAWPAGGKLERIDPEGGVIETWDVPPGGRSLGPFPAGYHRFRGGGAVLPLAVLRPRTAYVPGPSGVAIDTVFSRRERRWFPGEYERLAELYAQTGITEIRDRSSHKAVEPQPGEADWSDMLRAQQQLLHHGIASLSASHDTPAWSREDRRIKAVADDLDTYRRFAVDLAKKLSPSIRALEPWNEPDHQFFDGLPDTFMALQKTAYLTQKTLNPGVVVTTPSYTGMAAQHPVNGRFFELQFGAGLAHYSDVFNYHQYADSPQIASLFAKFQAVAEAHGAAGLPVWLTEFNHALRVLPGKKEPTFAQHLAHARYASRAFPAMLAAGIDRGYFFLFDFNFKSEQIWFGAFEAGDPPRTPNRRSMGQAMPAAAAIATSRYALGRALHAGSLTGLPEGVRGEAFDRGDGRRVVALWTPPRTAWDLDPPVRTIDLPVDTAGVDEAVDHLGVSVSTAENRVEVGEGAVYLLLRAGAEIPRLREPAPRPKPPIPAAEAYASPGIVIRPRFAFDAVEKSEWAYLVPTDGLAGHVDVHNHGLSPFTGELWVESPAGYRVSVEGDRTLELEPGAKRTFTVRVEAARPIESWSVARFQGFAQGRPATSPSLIGLVPDPRDAEALDTRRLDAPLAAWRAGGHPSGTYALSEVKGSGGGGGVQLRSTFNPPGAGAWNHAQLKFDRPQDLSAFNAFRFEYRTRRGDTAADVLPDSPADPTQAPPQSMDVAVLDGSNGIYRLPTGFAGSHDWKPVTIRFDQLSGVPWNPDPGGDGLDISSIRDVRIGGAVRQTKHFMMEFRDLRVVRIPEPEDPTAGFFTDPLLLEHADVSGDGLSPE